MQKKYKKHASVVLGSSVAGMLFLCLLGGCGAREYEFSAEHGIQSAAGENGQTTGVAEGTSGSADAAQNGAGASGNASATQDVTGASGSAGAAENGSKQNGSAAEDEKSPNSCYVHICGAIQQPGVYCVAEGSRLYEVILAAGGLNADAMDEAVNQAQEVTDGMQIYIPTRAEAPDGDWSGLHGQVSGSAGGMTTEQDARININTAGAEVLRTLPGIGESKAQAIIAYREKYGAFQSVDELMNVAGIKAGVYEKIKELIKV